MRTLLIILTLSSFTIISCASQKGTKDEYFGYNNSPTIQENTETPAKPTRPKRSLPPIDSTVTVTESPKAEWVNPMIEDDDPQDDYVDDASQQSTVAGYQPYSNPQYVPVVVPWWDSYSGWMGGYYSRPVIVVRYRNWYWGWNSYCDWYSPYYDFHPWYGGSFSYFRPRYYGWNRSFWRPWHHYPIYTYSHTNSTPRKPNSVRTWGPSRGVTSPVNSAVRSTIASPNATSSSPSIRNERGQSSSTTSPQPTNAKPSSSPITPSIRNERGSTGTGTPQSEIQHPLKRNETNPSTSNPTTGSTPNVSSNPVRNERSAKDATPSQRSESNKPSSGTSSPRQERSSAPARSSSAPARTNVTPAPRSTSTTPSTSKPTTNSPRGNRKP